MIQLSDVWEHEFKIKFYYKLLFMSDRVLLDSFILQLKTCMKNLFNFSGGYKFFLFVSLDPSKEIFIF